MPAFPFLVKVLRCYCLACSFSNVKAFDIVKSLNEFTCKNKFSNLLQFGDLDRFIAVESIDLAAKQRYLQEWGIVKFEHAVFLTHYSCV